MKMNKTERRLDAIFWYTLYALPFILLIITFWNDNPMTMSVIASRFLGMNSFATPVFQLLSRLFGEAGTFQLFPSMDVIFIVSWFINIHLTHVAVDIILFLPRWAHEQIDRFGGAN